jgi:hypothetical protein
MDATNLDEMIQADLETLKTLKVGIMPAKSFYERVFYRTLSVYFFFVGIQLLACFFALTLGGWAMPPESSAVRFEKSLAETEPFNNLISGMHARLNQVNSSSTETESSDDAEKIKAIQLQKKQAHEKKLRDIREDDNLTRKIEMFAGVLFSSLFFTLFFISKIKNVVIFQYQFQRHLQTGGAIASKITQAFTIYFGIFAITVLLFFNFFEQSQTLFAGVPAFLLAGIVTVILMEMELSRLGVSTLLRVLSQLFKQGNRLT